MSNSSVAPGFQFDTLSNWNLYVDAVLGDDTNSGADPNFPIKTIQQALNRVPKLIRHQVTVNVAAGNYASFVVAGFNTMPAENYATDYSWLHIKGAMQNCVPASTGSSSGALTAFANTDFVGNFAVCTDSLNNMTVNEYEGCYLKFTSGTGSTDTVAFPQMALIVSNTATTFTILAVSLVAPAAATGYQVVKPATFITSGVAAAVSSGTPTQVAFPAGVTGATFVNNIGQGYAISNIEFTLSASLTAGLKLQETRLRAFNCRFLGLSAASGPIAYNTIQNGTSTLVGFGLFINTTGFSSTNILVSTVGGGNQFPGPVLFNCYVKGGLNGITMANIGPPQLNTCFFKGQTTAGINIIGPMMASQLGNIAIDSCPTGISMTESVNTGLGLCSLGTNGIKITNATVAAVTMTGAMVSGALKGASGSTGNLVGVKLARGAVCVIASDCTLSGTTECTIDAVATDWATMRAATPKMVKNADYLTRIYQ